MIIISGILRITKQNQTTLNFFACCVWRGNQATNFRNKESVFQCLKLAYHAKIHPSGSEKVYVKVLEVMAMTDSKPKMDSN